jgi:hypothetical protein
LSVLPLLAVETADATDAEISSAVRVKIIGMFFFRLRLLHQIICRVAEIICITVDILSDHSKPSIRAWGATYLPKQRQK